MPHIESFETKFNTSACQNQNKMIVIEYGKKHRKNAEKECNELAHLNFTGSYI